MVLASADDGKTWDTLRSTPAPTRTTGPTSRPSTSPPTRASHPHPLRVHDGRRRGPQGLGDHRRRHRERRAPASAFSSDGWIRVDGGWRQKTPRYYIAEYRTYDGFDESLRTATSGTTTTPAGSTGSATTGVSTSSTATRSTWTTTWLPTSAGAAGWSWTPTQAGQRRLQRRRTDYAGFWRPRIQVRDAAFSLKPTRTQSIYFVDYDQGWGVAESTAPGKAGQPTFSDTRTYWYDDAREAGVKIPQDWACASSSSPWAPRR